jgi:hypothetical protein
VKYLLAGGLMKADQLLDLALTSRMVLLIVKRSQSHAHSRFEEVTEDVLLILTIVAEVAVGPASLHMFATLVI